MTHFQKSDLVVDGVRVQILEAGKGKPLIYFHGAGASRGFDELLPLAEKHRLIVPIHPGFGGSDDDLSINSVLDYVVRGTGSSNPSPSSRESGANQINGGQRWRRQGGACARDQDVREEGAICCSASLTFSNSGLEPYRRRLRHPLPLVAVEYWAARDQCIANHARRLR